MSLVFENLSFSYQSQPVLKQLDLTVEAGEIVCLLGASGSGKSTLLRLAAGLEAMQAGRITVSGNTLAQPGDNPPPEARPVGMMFQENALFPHMTIAQNVAFGVSNLPRAEQQARVSELLAATGLTGMDERYPHSLSGGQQQRVALARALAPAPGILLMDEPYGSIDSTLRRSLREHARRTLKQGKTSTVLVTHDPVEAMEMADRIAFLDDGQIVQCDSPQALYDSPVNPTVAMMFGNAQRLSGRAEAAGVVTAYGMIGTPDILPEGEVQLVIRATGLQMHRAPDGALQVVDLRYVGDGWLAFLLPKNAPANLPPLRVATGECADVAVGDTVTIEAKGRDFFLFPA